MKNTGLLFAEITRWDGTDPKERDRLRAKMYCNVHGVEFDSIVGTVDENGNDTRHILYTDPSDSAIGLGGGGGSYEMAEIDIWPAFAAKPRPWWRKVLGLS